MEEKAKKLIKIPVKPFSVNKAWKGKRYRTQDYQNFSAWAKVYLPKVENFELPEGKKWRGVFIWYVSNVSSDEDNPRKPFQDVIQELYQFNDAWIWESFMKKVKVKKGEEGIAFYLEAIDPEDLFIPDFKGK